MTPRSLGGAGFDVSMRPLEADGRVDGWLTEEPGEHERRGGLTIEPVPPAEVVAAIHRAGEANPLLGIGLGELGPGPSVARLIDEVGAWAGTRERRVAGSLVVLGYSARLVGPTVAVLLRDGILLDVRGVQVAYEPSTGFRLALPVPAGWRAPVTRWGGHVVDGPLTDLIRAVSVAAPVASGLLWGNVASGVAGALRSIAQSGFRTPEECLAAGSVLLEYGPLRGGGTLTIHNGQLQYARKSCCLFYRLEAGGLCGDCSLLKLPPLR